MKQQQELVYISDYRCRLDNKNRIIINIGSNERIMAGVKVTGTIDGKSLPVDVIYRNTIRSRFCYRNINNKFNREYQVCADVNNNFKTLQITLKFAGDNEGVVKTITIPGKRFRKNCDRIQGCVDVCEKTDEGCKIEGWAADAKEVKIKVLCDGKELTGDFRRVFRQDIADYYQDGETSVPLGYTFDIINNSKDIKKVRVIYYTDDRESDFKFNISKSGKKSIPLTDVVNKVVIYTRKYGFTGMLKKAYRKITHKPMIDYNEWYKAHKPSEEELKEQRKVKFDYMPKFSIIIPVYRPVPKYFTDMIKSIKHQTYSNWEICIADGGGEGHTVDKTLFGLVKGDKVRYVAISENLGISGNTNEAMKMATGDYFVLGDHDDVFEPDALFECARAINSKEKPDMIYSDEDKITEDGKKHCEPYFKPDFNIDLLRNNNYICHLFVFSRELSEKVGYFRKEFDGAQDYDMILRCSEKAKCIKHIPKVLYSWRIYSGSTSANPESKRYAFTAGKRAIDEHFKRMGIKAEAEMNETYLGIYRSRYEITGNPLISILIPNKDHTDDLDKCIKSILKQKYENYEIIVIENNSTEDATFEYYKKLEKECNKVKVVYYKDKEQMVLRSCTMTDEGPDNEWKTLATWLYDETVGTQKDADSIANDFIEGVSGTLAIKRAKQVKQKKKKDDDGTADPKFLAKRFVTYFPELREEIKNEEDCYFPFRGATFAKEHIAPKIPMYIKRANKNEIEKFANVFNVQYNNGDVDTRAIITIVLLNSLDDAEYNALYEHFNDELKVAALNARAFKGKTVKPEKVKKVKAKANTLTNN